jgi:hypothetical protein
MASSQKSFLRYSGFAQIIALIGVAAVTVNLSGCGAVHTMVKKRNLDVQTKMSETLFLEPVAPAKRIIFIDIRNTTDQELTVKDTIIEQIQAAGYKVTNNPDDANFMLQANILQLGKSDLRESGGALMAGYGGAVVGAGLAYAGGADSGRGIAGAGLLGGLFGVMGDAMVDDTLYSMIIDLQIRERPGLDEKVVQSQETHAKQGTASKVKQSVSGGQVNWKTYRTRIVSTANKANLAFDEAKPPLIAGLVRVISGVF